MSETFACRLTAPLPSAIATIAIRGSHLLEIVSRCLNRPLLEHQWTFGRVRFLKWPIRADSEHVVACLVDEQTFEIHCHGGVAISNAILAALSDQGCIVVDQSEWSELETANGNSELESSLKRLCEQALMRTSSERTAGILLDQANGALHKLFMEIDSLARDRQWLDAAKVIADVSRWNRLGLHLVEPWRVVLAGPPNVGKSSLINALSGHSLAIVHEEAGTTRDWIEAETQIDGWPVTLTDTAGIRQTDELVEREGVQRATERIAQADLVVIVVDGTQGWTRQHDQIAAMCSSQKNHGRILIAWNKSDLSIGTQNDLSGSPEKPNIGKVVRCSAKGDIAELLASISRELVPEHPSVGQPIVFDESQQQLLQKITICLQSRVSLESDSELNLLLQVLTQKP